MKKAVLKTFAIFTGKLQVCSFIKDRLQHKCFPLNISKFHLVHHEVHLLTAGSDFLKQLHNSGQ